MTTETTTAKGESVMATLLADNITQSGQGYLNNSLVEIQNFKSNLAGGDVETAAVTGDHDSRSSDFTNLVTYSVDQVGGDPLPLPVSSASPSYRYAVRRITPVEAERLQGFVCDGWTRPSFTPEQITDALVDQFVGIHQQWAAINGKPDAKPKSRKWVREWLLKISSPECPDGPRYKAIGNSMSVNVMQWIGRRIAEAASHEPPTTSQEP